VNRGRVIHVDAVMQPLSADHAINGATIVAGSSVEDAIKIIAREGHRDLVVIDPAGMPLGTVDLKRLASAAVSLH